METRDVTLPNGAVLQGVPVGTSDQEVMQEAIRLGAATAEDFGVAQAAPEPTVPKIDPMAMVMSDVAGKSPRPEPSMADKYVQPVAKAVSENLDIPLGIAGSIIGAPAGPAGVVGGGAAGTMLGSALSSGLKGEDAIFAKAVEDGLWSIGIDVATLGLGKLGRAGWAALRNSGKSADEVVKEIAQRSGTVPRAGSPESIAQTQQMLTKGGATLTPYQTGKANAWETVKEQIGRTGIWSAKTFDENAAKVNDVAQQEFNRIMANGTGLAPAELGKAVFDTINTGKKALGSVYDASVKEVRSGLTKTSSRVPTKRLEKVITNFTAPFKKEVGTMLNKDTLTVLDEFQDTLSKLPKGGIKADELLDLEKMLRDRINELGDFNSKMYNGKAAAELADLSSKMRDAISSEIYRLDPKLGKKYATAKQGYSQGIAELLPEMNKSMLTQGTKDNFDLIGQSLIGVSNTSKATAMMNSIRRSYSAAKQAGIKGADLPYPTIREAEKAVRQSYLSNMFKGADDVTFDINSFKTLANKMETPKEAAKMQAVLGAAYMPTKRLMNLMADATTKPESNLGQLMLRSKEYGVGTALAATTVGGATIGIVPTLGTAAAVLVTPKMMAAAATNPKVANKLIAFDKKVFKTDDAMRVAAANLVADLAGIDESVKDAVTEYYSTQGQAGGSGNGRD